MIRPLLKWGVKAVGGLAANIALLTLWVDGVGLPAWVAIFPNFIIISLTGYVVADRWIWTEGVSPNRLQGHATQYAGMQAANLGGKTVNYALYLLLLPVVEYRAAWILGALATVVLTFALNHAWWTRTSRSAVAKRR